MKRGAVIGCLTWHGGGRQYRRMLKSDGRTVGRSDNPRMAVVALAGIVFLSASPTVRLSGQLSPRDSAVHALNRLAYGPRPGDVDRVAQGGVMSWIDQQLAPEHIDDARLTERERRFDLLGYSRDDLARLYVDAQRARRERQRADTMMGDLSRVPPLRNAERGPGGKPRGPGERARGPGVRPGRPPAQLRTLPG